MTHNRQQMHWAFFRMLIRNAWLYVYSWRRVNEKISGLVFRQTAETIYRWRIFIELLKSISDPRLPFYALPNDDGEYLGSAKMNPIPIPRLGSYAGTQWTDLPLVTYFEAKFIEAEATEMGNEDEAAVAYNDAVKHLYLKLRSFWSCIRSSVCKWRRNQHYSGKDHDQKYIAMFTQPEAWTDWRRTDFPVLIPNPDGDVAGISTKIPDMPSERNYNTNAIVISDILTPVWWMSRPNFINSDLKMLLGLRWRRVINIHFRMFLLGCGGCDTAPFCC